MSNESGPTSSHDAIAARALSSAARRPIAVTDSHGRASTYQRPSWAFVIDTRADLRARSCAGLPGGAAACGSPPRRVLACRYGSRPIPTARPSRLRWRYPGSGPGPRDPGTPPAGKLVRADWGYSVSRRRPSGPRGTVASYPPRAPRPEPTPASRGVVDYTPLICRRPPAYWLWVTDDASVRPGRRP